VDQASAPAAPRTRWTLRWLWPTLMVLAWLLVGGVLGTLGGKLGEVTQSDTVGYLPAGAESKAAVELGQRFPGQNATPAVLVYSRDGGIITEADRAAIADDISRIQRSLADELAGAPSSPVTAEDGKAVQVVVPLTGSDMYELGPSIDRLRGLLRAGDGLTVHVTGPAGVAADLNNALGGIDLMLVAVTAIVILVILVVVYRSPVLPFLVLGVAGTALGVMQGIIYLAARQGVLTIGAEVQGILNVLVLGAGTDYALLLVSRYREELRRHERPYDAMRAAWRAARGPIVASGATVILALLCLLVSDLGLNRGLGPAGAIGIACAMVAMLTFLPAVLLLFGRVAFWPKRPSHGSEPAGQHGGWARVAGFVDRRPRVVWITTALVLVLMSMGVVRLNANGIPESEQVIASTVDSKTGQRILAAHFPAGAGNPAIVITDAGSVPAVVAAAQAVPGVESAAPYTGDAPADAADPSPPVVVDGLAQVYVTFVHAADSDEAMRTVSALRDAVHAVPGAEAKVGGYTAVQVDFNAAAQRDRLAMPLLLLVVLLVLVLLLRALIVPLLLVATVVLSFFAAIGVSGVVFHDLLGFPGVDSTYPLHAFVFLVALGVDYNIFLMTRAREETIRVGARQGTLRGLALTGGVITSAGIVLAATFSALALIPLVLLVELAFTVAFGVLLDTFVVRSLLVPALVVDIGRRVWWPSRLARRTARP
jgi:putative drug exporter of the RND superfamily